jgi:hypothetical protein
MQFYTPYTFLQKCSPIPDSKTLQFQLPISTIGQLELAEKILIHSANVENLQNYIHQRSSGTIKSMLSVCFTDELLTKHPRTLVGRWTQQPEKNYKILDVILSE